MTRCDACLMPKERTPLGLGLYCICEEIQAEVELWRGRVRGEVARGHESARRMHLSLEPMTDGPAVTRAEPAVDPWAGVVRLPGYTRVDIGDMPFEDAWAQIQREARQAGVPEARVRASFDAQRREERIEAVRASQAIGWFWRAAFAVAFAVSVAVAVALFVRALA